MSTAVPRAASQSGDATAFPILMRLPDLRQSGGEPGCAVEAAASVPDVHVQSEAVAEVIAPPEPAAVAAIASSEPNLPAALVESASPVDAAEISKPAVVSKKLSPNLTDALPASQPEPVTPAAARRQRALERQRRQTVVVPPTRTWWNSHLPVIAVGFLVAFMLTIYAARRHRANQRAADRAATEPEIFQLDIDHGLPTDTTHEPPTLAVDTAHSTAGPAPEAKPVAKSPPLLSAKPKATEAEAAVAKPAVPDLPGTEGLPIATRPADEKPSSAAEHKADAEARVASKPQPADLNAPANTAPANTAADYPSTEPAAYRPGGRIPKSDRAPIYPQTSTPNLR